MFYDSVGPAHCMAVIFNGTYCKKKQQFLLRQNNFLPLY